MHKVREEKVTLVKKDSIYWSKTLANTLATGVSNVIALSPMTFSRIAELANITDSDIRRIRNVDVDLPISVWMHFVLAARAGAADGYIAETRREYPEFQKLPPDQGRCRLWLSALATRIVEANKRMPAGRRADEVESLLKDGGNASFHRWAKTSLDLEVAHGLDASWLEIVPQETMDTIDRIWHDSTL